MRLDVAPKNRTETLEQDRRCGEKKKLHQPKGFVIVMIFFGLGRFGSPHGRGEGFAGSSIKQRPQNQNHPENLSERLQKTVNTLVLY